MPPSHRTRKLLFPVHSFAHLLSFFVELHQVLISIKRFNAVMNGFMVINEIRQDFLERNQHKRPLPKIGMRQAEKIGFASYTVTVYKIQIQAAGPQ